MNQAKYVFASRLRRDTFLPARIFDRCVQKYQGNKWIKHFSCYNQLLSMMLGQLSGRESLRDLIVTLDAHKGKYYHLVIGLNVSRMNLANAKEHTDNRIYADCASVLVHSLKKF